MNDIPILIRRRSIRLKKYDYAQPGAYFITMVSYQRKNLFGQIIDGKMILNQVGKVVENIWHDIPKHFLNTCSDIYVIIPNHIHGIIEIIDEHNVEAEYASPQPNHIRELIDNVNDDPVGATHESPLHMK